MPSWFIFTDSELETLENNGFAVLADSLRENCEKTGDGTLLVRPTGPESAQLAALGKLPRRMAPDPPTDTSAPARPLAAD